MHLLSLATAVLVGLAAAAPVSDIQELEKRQLSTFNEVERGPCKEVSVFYARGTSEFGNVGSIAGPPFFDALRARRLDIARQGVNDYPADVPGFLAGGSRTGIRWLSNAIDRVAQRCPNTKIVTSGYSQGAQVARKGTADARQKSRVEAVVLWGDPLQGDGIPGISSRDILTICNIGDTICLGTGVPSPPHLVYALTAGRAAAFVAERV